ncbi:Protein root UVB sensitive 2, chloroplastic [Asimina triloba]
MGMAKVDDSRPVFQKVFESFLNTFFPSGYPYSVNEGYLTYTQFRALQHFSSATLSVLSTQSLLVAAGLRPTSAQATVVSWILKDGMEHMGKLICSNMGARMDSEPKSWRILADVLYDLGSGLEVLSPFCPHLFLQVAGLGNFAKGMAVVAARATRLPIYSSFAKEGNLSDLCAKGEAISTLFNVAGIGVGIQLASTICSSMQGKSQNDVIEDAIRRKIKDGRLTSVILDELGGWPLANCTLIAAPLLSAIHIYSVSQEMRAAPVNTLNPQRTAMIVADFLKTGKASSPADLRYRENLLFPERGIADAGNVKVGRSIQKIVKKPSKLRELRELFLKEKFLISHQNELTDLVLEHTATGEDALKGWLIAAYAADLDKSGLMPGDVCLREAYKKAESVFAAFISELKTKGWHTDQFLDGTGSRFSW